MAMLNNQKVTSSKQPYQALHRNCGFAIPHRVPFFLAIQWGISSTTGFRVTPHFQTILYHMIGYSLLLYIFMYLYVYIYMFFVYINNKEYTVYMYI
jgi:hypothetical protein